MNDQIILPIGRHVKTMHAARVLTFGNVSLMT
jgi:hypothetical protein